MTDENSDKAIAPETMKLESGQIMMNVEPKASEATDNDAISPEDMKLGIAEIMINAEATANGTSDIDLFPSKKECGIVDEEVTEQLEESCDSSFKEEGDSSRGKSDIQEDTLVQISPTRDSDVATGQLRKKPTLVVVGSNHKFNVRSRYLSDSIASCHDFCKFGHKHETEKKTRRLTLGTLKESKPLIKTSSNDPGKCVLGKVTKEKESHRRLSHPGTIPEKADLMHLEDKNLPKDINQSKMKSVQSERKSSSAQSLKSSGRNKAVTQAVKKIVTQSPNLQKTSTQKLKEVQTQKEEGSNCKGEMEVIEKEPMCSSSATSLNKEGGYSQDVNKIKGKEPISDTPKTTLKSGYSKGVKDIKAKEPMSNSPKTHLKKSPSLKAKLYKNRRSSFNSGNQINSGEPKVDGRDDTTEINPNLEPAERTSKATLYGENSQNSSRDVRSRKHQGSKGNQKGTVASLLSFSSRESSKPHREKLGSEVKKNKQVGFKTEASGSKTSTPSEKLSVMRRLKSLNFKNTRQNDIIRDDSRLRTITPREKSTIEQKWKPKRKEKSNVEEKDASAWKVKFKRGTVVALQVTNNAPKRLQFRRARTLAGDQIAKSGTDGQLKNEHAMDNELHDKIGPEKVRLRHQEASEKKDDVDLNNVIEETASKLVKTRKSKVKALVGAFETVMSLGDRKRLVETGAS